MFVHFRDWYCTDISVSIISIIFSQFLLFITLDVFLVDAGFDYATFYTSQEVCFYLLAFNILVKYEKELDFLR